MLSYGEKQGDKNKIASEAHRARKAWKRSLLLVGPFGGFLPPRNGLHPGHGSRPWIPAMS